MPAEEREKWIGEEAAMAEAHGAEIEGALGAVLEQVSVKGVCVLSAACICQEERGRVVGAARAAISVVVF